jgi:hypothetical protein
MSSLFILWYGTTACRWETSFIGERLGASSSADAETSFFRDREGRIVVHVVRRNDADVEVYGTLEEAAADYRLEMERAGVIPPRSVGLDEVAGQ